MTGLRAFLAGERALPVILALCALAWAVLVARGMLAVKGTDAFIATVPQPRIEAYAREQLESLQRRSFASGREYCAIVFEDSEGQLGTSRILEGDRASCDIIFFDEPGMGPVASIHTHGAFDPRYDSEVPSAIDMASDIAGRTDGYVSTPGGRLWHIDWTAERARLVCGPACLTSDPAHRDCAGDAIRRAFSYDQLRERASAAPRAC